MQRRVISLAHRPGRLGKSGSVEEYLCLDRASV
jgi:hypothetical protein